MLIDETDEFGNEVPLGKIVKLLKLQGEKKTGRKQKTSSSSVNTGNVDDVLGLVREINLDNQGDLGESQKSKPKKRQTETNETNEKPLDFSSPKRKRSISNNRPHSAKGSKNSDEHLLHTPSKDRTYTSLETKLKEKKDRHDSTDTGLLVSPTSKTPVSKGNKGAKKSHTDILNSGPKVISSIPMLFICLYKTYEFQFLICPFFFIFFRTLLQTVLRELLNREV